jgi:predicted SPOUT superfamily RNA methylase MTH1
VALHGKRLTVGIPDTVVEDDHSLSEKTLKLGAIARSCSILGVDSVIIFGDKFGRGEASLIQKVLEFLETPQYLRKRIFPLDPALRYAGMLPPLRIPSHKPRVPVNALRLGEAREGVTISKEGKSVDVGLDRPLQLTDTSSLGTRVTVRITGLNPFTGHIISRNDVGEYWGYTVEIKTAEQLLSDSAYDLKIGTSRNGDSLLTIMHQLETRFLEASSVLLLVGSPSRGLFMIFGEDLRGRLDFVVNLFSDQKVVTVRTEEALLAALYLLEVLSVD